LLQLGAPRRLLKDDDAAASAANDSGDDDDEDNSHPRYGSFALMPRSRPFPLLTRIAAGGTG
jgi:hypothetical protein